MLPTKVATKGFAGGAGGAGGLDPAVERDVFDDLDLSHVVSFARFGARHGSRTTRDPGQSAHPPASRKDGAAGADLDRRTATRVRTQIAGVEQGETAGALFTCCRRVAGPEPGRKEARAPRPPRRR